MNTYQQINNVETKKCKRTRGVHTETEEYCGRILPISCFTKGRTRCKECNNTSIKKYNENKCISNSPTILENISKKYEFELNKMIEENKNLLDINTNLNELISNKEIELNKMIEENKNLLDMNQNLNQEFNRKNRENQKFFDELSVEHNEEINTLKNDIQVLEDQIRTLKS